MKVTNQTTCKLPPAHCITEGFIPIRIKIVKGAWCKGEANGWIVGPKNEVGANPIVTDDGFFLAWFDNEIERVGK